MVAIPVIPVSQVVSSIYFLLICICSIDVRRIRENVGDMNRGGSDPGIASGVVNIFSTEYAFAALMSDGSVKTWGE